MGDNFPVKMKRKGDFQDIEIWREINYRMIKYMSDNYSGTLIIPMTLNNKKYFDEIITNLKEENIDVKHYII